MTGKTYTLHVPSLLADTKPYLLSGSGERDVTRLVWPRRVIAWVVEAETLGSNNVICRAVVPAARS